MPLGCSELQRLRLGERCFIRTVGSSRAGGSHAPENASDVDLQSNSAKTYKEKIEKKKVARFCGKNITLLRLLRNRYSTGWSVLSQQNKA